MTENKRFGLIVTDKAQRPVFQASRNIFGDDSDSDNESKKPVLLKPSGNTNRQAKIMQEKAILDDPTVYQYDEIYDTMSNKEDKNKIKEIKKPRYIENLLKSANKRKIENERRIERQVQKEREKEGDEFADKEIFVTSAYKKKLEEIRLEEEKEKREEYLESIGDVTKQQDLGGFYRHLYEQKLGKDDTSESKEKTSNKVVTAEENQRSNIKPDLSKKRNYRKRKTSENKILSDGEIEDSDEEINRMKLEDIKAKKSKQNEKDLDADSDLTDDTSDDNAVDQSKVKKSDGNPENTKSGVSSDVTNPQSKERKSIEISENVDKENVEVESKPKIDIWKKRTVGLIFEQALQRYYERKASRGR